MNKQNIFAEKLNIKTLKPLVLVSCLVWGGSANAFTTNITERYYMGDADSKASAREIVVAKVKQLASDKAGVYIENDKSMTTSSGLKQRIKMLSASIVKLSDISERVGMTNSNRMFFELSAKAYIDDSELKNRIKALRSSADKDKAISKLQQQNKDLFQKMAELEKALKKKTLSSNEVAMLMKKQNAIYQEIEDNNQAVSQVFQRGTLLAMANNNADKSKQEYKRFKTEYIQAWHDLNQYLEPKIESVKNNGRYYEVLVSVPLNKHIYLKMKNLVGTKENAIDYYDLRGLSKQQKETFLTRVKVIDKLPAHLSVTVSGVSNSIKFYGIWDKGFFNHDPYTSAGLNYSKLEDAVMGNGYSKQKIGFINKEKHNDYDWYIKNGKIFFKLTLTKEQASSADKVVTKFVVNS